MRAQRSTHATHCLDGWCLGGHESLKVGSVDHATIDLELREGIVDLGGRELVSKGHERVSESLGIDLSVDLEGLERLEDGFVIIGSTGHLASEKGDHLGEVHGSVSLVEHGLGLSSADGLAVVGEGGGQVRGGQKTVLVHVHDAEGLLELLDGGVGERVENVGFLGHFELNVVPTTGCLSS